jgi:Subtilase family/Putative metal-binding motif
MSPVRIIIYARAAAVVAESIPTRYISGALIRCPAPRTMNRAGLSILLSVLALGSTAAASARRAQGPAVADEVTARLAAQGEARVVILLDLGAGQATPGVTRADALAATVAAVRRGQDDLLLSLGPGDFRLGRRLQSVPLLAGTLTRSGLERLRARADVLRIDPEIEGHADLAQSVPLIKADQVQALGFNGAGMTVGIVDTGVDTSHPDLADSVDGQVCFCQNGGGCCPNGQSTQTGPGSALDDNGHGTHVSGIVTGNGTVAPRGVAPGAKIVMAKVLPATGSTCCMSDVLAGLDYMLVNRPDVDSVNISIGTSVLYAGNCDNVDSTTQGFAAVIGGLRARGTLTFISAGNSASPGAMSAPACVSGAMSTGSTYDANIGGVGFSNCTDATTAADQVSCFSNSDAVTDIFAPGGAITSTRLGGGSITFFGTSMASPHGAACAADILQARPGLNAAAQEAAIEATGKPITDARNNITIPRIDCLAALQIRNCVDADGDGFWQAGGASCPAGPYADCDDGDAGRFPGNPEACDGKDNNCDGQVDEGFDPDHDGLASCFDDCPADRNPGQEDFDHDGQGDLCDLDDGYIDMRLDDSRTVRFQRESGWPVFDLYRVNLGDLHDANHDGAADGYGTCLAENLAGPTFDDGTMPAVGEGFMYMVRGRAGSVESSLGNASNGAPRVNVTTCEQVFGVPPVIDSVVMTLDTGSVSCDFTNVVETWLCTSGLPGAHATAAVMMGGTYPKIHLVAHVTDPDSTPGSDDIATVTSDLTLPTGTTSLPLLDDGSATSVSASQNAGVGEDCTNGAACSCGLRTYATRSADTTALDAIYTRSSGLIGPGLSPFLGDCAMMLDAVAVQTAQAGAAFDVHVTATDRNGHPTTWSGPLQGIVPAATFTCLGDACGCCLITATDPVAQCHGLAGMPSPDYPTGICKSL